MKRRPPSPRVSSCRRPDDRHGRAAPPGRPPAAGAVGRAPRAPALRGAPDHPPGARRLLRLHAPAGAGRRAPRPPRHRRQRAEPGAQPASRGGPKATAPAARGDPHAGAPAVPDRRRPGPGGDRPPPAGRAVRRPPHAHLEGRRAGAAGGGASRPAPHRGAPAAWPSLLRLLRPAGERPGGARRAAARASGAPANRALLAGRRGAPRPRHRKAGRLPGGALGDRPASLPPGAAGARRLSRAARLPGG